MLEYVNAAITNVQEKLAARNMVLPAKCLLL